MATYKYRQNLSSGSKYGYVEYNITPDFGTVLAPGETFEITGKIYSSKKIYGISVEAVHIGTSAWLRELGKVEKTISAGKSATFTAGLVVPDLNEIETSERQVLLTYINFGFLMNSDLDVGETTDRFDEQRLSLIKERLTPVVSGASFSDATGAYEHFSGAVQGKSDLSAALTVQFDPLDDSLRIESARLSFGDNTVDIPKENITDNVLHIGKLDFSGSFENFGVQVTDSKGKTGEYSGGAFEVYPYSAPRLERNGNRELAERYETVTLPNGTVVDRLSDDAQTLWANFKASVSPIGGQNTWSIWRYYRLGGERPGEGGGGQTPWMEVYRFPTTEDNVFEKVFTEDKNVFFTSDKFLATERHTVEIEVRDYFESALLRFTVEKSGGYFNIEKHGVAAGMRSTATEREPKFESAYPVYPYGGIKKTDGAAYEVQLTLDPAFRLYDEDPGLRLMVYGNVVHLSGIITPVSAISGGTQEHVITSIQADFAPKYPVTVIQQGTGTAVWMLRVYPATDPVDPLKAVFSRYRNGGSYASCAAGNWLPLDAVWIV